MLGAQANETERKISPNPQGPQRVFGAHGLYPHRPRAAAGMRRSNDTPGAMNPIAVAEEAGLEAESTANSGTIDFETLVRFRDLWATPDSPSRA